MSIKHSLTVPTQSSEEVESEKKRERNSPIKRSDWFPRASGDDDANPLVGKAPPVCK